MRLFAAVELPENIKGALWAAAFPLKKIGGIAVVKKENFHITLKFIGETDGAGFEKIKERALSAAKRPPELIEISGFGRFPENDCARVLWAGIAQGADFIAEIAGFFSDLGPPEKTRGREIFAPHVTLARIKDPRRASRDTQNFLKTAAIDCAAFRPDGISVIKSELAPAGAVYETLFRAGFKI